MTPNTPLADAVVIAAAVTTVWMSVLQGQTLPPSAVVASLRQGGYVLVMRHASSPLQPPDKQTANPDNINMERQLDEAGRAGAAAMGKALRDLRIPIGTVLSSPTYRALETVRLARLDQVQSHVELGDRGRSMQGVTEADGAWLRERAMRLPTGTNTLIVTHMPNIARAFPDWAAVADGEVVIVGSGDQGRPRVVGRITIEEWSRLR